MDPSAHEDIREAVRALCRQFPDAYHREVDDSRAYPDAFVEALTKAGWMAALIPEEYSGSGLGLTEASVIMEEINRHRDLHAVGMRAGSWIVKVTKRGHCLALMGGGG